MRQQNTLCVWAGEDMCSSMEPGCQRAYRGKQKKRVKMKKQVLSSQEFTFILFTHLAIEETP